jgi:hypothetical protein
MMGLVCLPMTLPPRTPSISRGVFCAETGADHADARMCARLVILSPKSYTAPFLKFLPRSRHTQRNDSERALGYFSHSIRHELFPRRRQKMGE